MQVMAFCSPLRPEWRWRIVGHDGEVVEESYQSYVSIAAAVNGGQNRARELDLQRAPLTRESRMEAWRMRRR